MSSSMDDNATETDKSDHSQTTAADEGDNVRPTPSKDSKQPGRTPAAYNKVDWLLCIHSMADVRKRPKPLDVYIRALIESVRNWQKGHEEPVVFHYEVPLHNSAYGSINHLRLQNQCMVAIGHSIYLDLCMNLIRIERLHIIAAEGGAYLALRIIEFVDWYGAEFVDEFDLFVTAWISFLARNELGERNEEKKLNENKISPLIRSMILVQPSLPAPRGFNKLMWKWLKPKIYEHIGWSRPTEYDISAGKKRRKYFIVRYEGPEVPGTNLKAEDFTGAILMDLPSNSAFDCEIFRMNDMSTVESCKLTRWLEERLSENIPLHSSLAT